MKEPLATGLAATKLRPPTPPDQLVRRSRLSDLLDAGIDGHVRLVLVSAPAGSGKSTLLASWLTGRQEASAWLQVEDSDSDPIRFWTYLAEAIGQAQPNVSSLVKPVIIGSRGDELAIVSALVTALAQDAEPMIVVIDDYHLISNTSVHHGVERLIELCPPEVTIVISTRFDPPFRLGRLRVRNHVSEIRGDDLRFDPQEAAGLLGDGGQSLADSQLDLLSARTEGWAAGLVLAGLSLGQSTDPGQFIEEFRGDDMFVVDYLSEEFLAGISTEHRQRLLQTSILEQLNGSLVDAVTATTGGRQWLSDTAASNQLMIGLDRTGDWFRYHHLLRDLLRLEANEAIPGELPELHRRAAAWFESEGDDRRAVAHWLAAGDRHEAGRLMYSYGPKLMSDSQIETLRAVLEELGDVAETMAWCALLWGWIEFIDGHYARAEDWVVITHDVAPKGFDQTITAPLRMNIFLGRGDIDSALTIARELSAAGRFEHNTSDLATVAGGAYMWAGQTDAARATLDLAIEKSADEHLNSAHLLSMVYKAVVEFDSSSTDAARSAAAAVLETADEFGMASYYRMGLAYAIRARTDSDPARARADAVHAVDLVRRTTGDLALGYVLTICGDTLIDLGDAAGEALLTEARTVVDRCPDPGIVARLLDRIESRHSIESPTQAPVAEIVEQLTERETAVMRYLPTRMSQREIASELFVSLNTVKTHCSAIYRKLGVDNRKAAVQAARDLHLL